jgi:hypothetical protein
MNEGNELDENNLNFLNEEVSNYIIDDLDAEGILTIK